MKSAVLLPIVLLASALLSAGGVPAMGEIGKVAGAVLLLGPLAGVVVGFLS